MFDRFDFISSLDRFRMLFIGVWILWLIIVRKCDLVLLVWFVFFFSFRVSCVFCLCCWIWCRVMLKLLMRLIRLMVVISIKGYIDFSYLLK